MWKYGLGSVPQYFEVRPFRRGRDSGWVWSVGCSWFRSGLMNKFPVIVKRLVQIPISNPLSLPKAGASFVSNDGRKT